MKYEIPTYTDGTVVEGFILRINDDNSRTWIPTNAENSDYQAYLAYVANGNQVPTPPEFPTV